MNRIFQNTFRILAVLMLSAWAGASFAGSPTNGTVPEPTTMLLIGAGVGAAALVRRMRK